MIKIKTNTKIFFATIISKIITLFINKKRVIKRNNIKYDLDLSEGIDLRIFLNFREERGLFNLKNILPKKGKYNFIDIGANIGTVSLALSNEFKNSKIYAIEPTDYAYNKFKKNLSLNPNLNNNIKSYQLFIGKRPLKNIFASWKLNFKKDDKHYVHKGLKKETNGKSITLDNFVEKIGRKIDFVKIDTDGHEYEVLQSGIKFLKRDKPIIHIEFAPYLHSEYGFFTENIIDLIQKKLNYEFYTENLNKIKNIREYSKTIINTSENFFLLIKGKKK